MFDFDDLDIGDDSTSDIVQPQNPKRREGQVLAFSEVMIASPLVLVFSRPSIDSVVAGALQQNDVVVVVREQNLKSSERVSWHEREANPDFLQVKAGSWVRHCCRRAQFLQLKADAWIHRALSPGCQSSYIPSKAVAENVQLWRRDAQLISLKHDVDSESGETAGKEPSTLEPQIPVSSASVTTASEPDALESESTTSDPSTSDPSEADLVSVEPADVRKSVQYYGICDLKYDKRRPEGQRVRILELGSGLLSRFSGCGSHIPRVFKELFKLERPLDRSILVGNKKVTHDVFVECGFENLLPRQVCFPRVYTPSLANDIQCKLGIQTDDASVVLKLVNRCRGAGVVVAKVGEELDHMLQRLLSVPSNHAEHLEGEIATDELLGSDPCSLEEQCVHWWSNECPVFVAEVCEVSHPIQKSTDTYDATMRIGFVLSRSGKKAHLAVDFLGGYWKLPAAPTSSSDVRARCVSKASSGTAAVAAEDFKDVAGQLRRALGVVFTTEKSGLGSIPRRYPDNFMLFSFILARHAAGLVARRNRGKSNLTSPSMEQRELREATEPMQAQKFLSIAEAKLLPPETASLDACRRTLEHQDVPIRAVASYIQRLFGAADAQRGDWAKARGHFKQALRLHSHNASAEHLLGICCLRKFDFGIARGHFVRSLRLDPDFKSNYVNLGFVELSCSQWNAATAVSEAGLQRHPQAFQCSYNLGLALAQRLLEILRDAARSSKQRSQAEQQWLAPACELLQRSSQALRRAKVQCEQATTLWSDRDDELLESLEDVERQLCVNEPPSAPCSDDSPPHPEPWQLWEKETLQCRQRQLRLQLLRSQSRAGQSLVKLGDLLRKTNGWTLIHWRP